MVGLVVLFLVFAVCVTLGGGLGPAMTADLIKAFVVPGVAVLALPLSALLLLFWGRFAERRAVRRWRASHPEVVADPRVAAYLREYESTGKADYRRLADVLRTASSLPHRCRIACAEDVQVPTPPDTLIEPVLIEPSRVMLSPEPRWPSVVGLCVVGMLVLEWQAHSSPVRLLAAGALIVLAAWVWRCVLRPHYIRFVPGLIEVLHYRPFGGPPRVVRLPLDADTVIFVGSHRPGSTKARRVIAEQAVWELVVCRPERVQALHFRSVPGQSERIWHALLSTAPTPSLTYDTL